MLGEIFGVDGIVVVIVLVVVLFGGAAIPKLARNLGSAKNQFEKGLEDGEKATGPPKPPPSGRAGRSPFGCAKFTTSRRPRRSACRAWRCA